MFRWYAVNTYSGHENKVKQNLEHRVVSLGQERNVRQIVIPTEQISEMKDGQKVQTERRTMPGYVLVNMDLNEDSWTLVKGTPGVTGFVGAQQKPVPLSQTEIDRLRTARAAFLGTFAVAGHRPAPAQRVSRCAVWHLHQRQYLRSCSRSGSLRLLLFVW